MIESLPALAPMPEEGHNPSNSNRRQSGGLGAALAALTNTSRIVNNGRASLFLDEPMEAGLGVGHYQDAEDEVLSVQHHQQQNTRNKTKRRSSETNAIVENSRKFHQRFVKFMSDYSERNAYTQPDNLSDPNVDGNNLSSNNMEEDTSNRFPTRATDLRHVDQSINLMDASSARYGHSDEEDFNDEEEEEEEDVYSNYMYGFSTPSPPEINGTGGRRGSLQMVLQNGVKYLRRGSEPPRNPMPNKGAEKDGLELQKKDGVKKRSSLPQLGGKGGTVKLQIPGCGGLDRAITNRDRERAEEEEWEDFSPVKKPWQERYRPVLRWTLLIVLFLCSAIFLLACLSFFEPTNTSSTSSWVPLAKTPDMTYDTAAPTEFIVPSETKAAEVNPVSSTTSGAPLATPGAIARRKLVLEHVIQDAFLSETHAPELDLQHPKAQIAMEWMAGYDKKAMTMLDEFRFKEKRTEDGVIINESQEYAPIVDRYVQAVYYFLAHPKATAKDLVLS